MKRAFPLVVAAVLMVADQMSKLAVVAWIPVNTVGWASAGDFLWLVHVRNLGVAFSMGNNLPDWLRMALFIVIPLGVMGAFLVFYWRDPSLTALQRSFISRCSVSYSGRSIRRSGCVWRTWQLSLILFFLLIYIIFCFST